MSFETGFAMRQVKRSDFVLQNHFHTIYLSLGERRHEINDGKVKL
jgi:hypothetical protein